MLYGFHVTIQPNEMTRRPRRKLYVCPTCATKALAGYRAILVCGACSQPMHRKDTPPAEPTPPVERPEGSDNETDRLMNAIAVLAAASDRAAVRDLLWEAGLAD
ncbi:hypothetical protein [Lichenicoccus sp.]|uniref:hypothetical protein n=1 Tax=Lichenicoccus sp. TaxID=2781899 RepID=UPI003D0D2D89